VKINKEPALLLSFDQIGRKHLDAGEVGKAVAEFRRLSALHPKEALHHSDIAKALLAGGMGAAARREAKRATEVEPKSAKAWATLGLVLVNDLIGREFGPGCDRKAAIEAYRKAKELAPDDINIRAELAVVLQYGEDRVRYGQGAPLDQAIDEYVAMKKEIEEANDVAVDRELMTLYAMSNRWDDLEKLLAETTDREKKDLYKVIVAGGREGGAAAIAAAASLDAAKRREIQSTAASTLAVMRLYGPAADLLAEAARGLNNAGQLRMQADLMRKTVRHEDLKLDRNDPQSLFKSVLVDFLTGIPEKELDKYDSADVRVIFEEDGIRAKEVKTGASARALKKAIANSATSKLMADIAISAVQIQQDGDEAVGFRLRSRGADSSNLGTAYVVKENGEYRFSGSDSVPPELALRALRLAEKNDVAAARQWLDWARDHVESGYGDDPVASQPFAAYWTRGKEASADDMRLAAALLLPDTKKSSELALPILKAARANAGDELQWRIDQALLIAYQTMENWNEMLVVSDRLSAKFPDSAAAFIASAIALTKLDRRDDVHTRALARLQRIPGDNAALNVLGDLALDRGAYEEAVGHYAGVLERANARPNDYNQHAWASVFAKADLDKAIEEAQHATKAEPEDYAMLNTLAVLYAEQGRSAEARETLLKSLEQHEDEDVHSEDWYVVGRIAENYGIADAAIEAYERVEKPERVPGSTYQLAQWRLKGLRK
jgi:tetratricopeptide (TPR) repeat protein